MIDRDRASRDGDKRQLLAASPLRRKRRSQDAPAGSEFDDQRLNTGLWISTVTERRLRRGGDDPRILLLHVPKTGGTSLRIMLRDHVAAKDTFISGGGYEWIDKSPNDLRTYRLFVGHNFLEPLYLFPEDDWVTVLPVRDPLAWWRSFYKFRRRELTKNGRDSPMLGMNMDEWVATRRDADLSNPQASWLLARARLMFDNPGTAQGRVADTAASIQRRGGTIVDLLDSLLNRLTVVGVTEDLEGLYLDLCSVLGWTPRAEAPVHRNVSHEPDAMVYLSTQQDRRLRALNRIDSHLHKQARERSREGRNRQPGVRRS